MSQTRADGAPPRPHLEFINLKFTPSAENGLGTCCDQPNSELPVTSDGSYPRPKGGSRDRPNELVTVPLMAADLALLSKLDNAVATGSNSRRTEALRHVTDLFIVEAAKLTDNEIELFDDVIARLAFDIEISARSLLAIRLAPVRNAPPKIIRALAFDDAIEVAAPVLSQSERLSDADLVANAQEKGQGHMLAISQRPQLSEIITDVLIERGDQQVLLSTVKNSGARISNSGFSRLVQLSNTDEMLAIRIGGRREIPLYLFRQLLMKESERVRTKLEAAQPALSLQIGEVVSEVADRIETEAISHSRNYSAALASIEKLRHCAELDDGSLMKVAQAGDENEVIAALAIMCDLSIPFVEKTITQQQTEILLLIARAIGLSWSTVKAILMLHNGRRAFSESKVAQLLASYERLKRQTAQEILRFYRTRERQAH